MPNFFWFIFNALISFTKSILNSVPKEQKVLKSIDFSSPDDIKEKLKSRDIQLALIDWVNQNLRPLENDEVYLKVAKGSRLDKTFKVTTDTIQKIIDVMMPFTVLGTPAHELGHQIFISLSGAALIAKDPFIASCYRNEINGAFFSAMFHDNSSGVQHRYIDDEWELNHGELAACIFFFNTARLLPRNIRLIASYAMATHVHILENKIVNNRTIRKKWEDRIFYNGKTPVRTAVWITRWTDRWENGGDPATHLPRHTMAIVNGALVGGRDLFGINEYNLSDQLYSAFIPKTVITEVPVFEKDGLPAMKDGKQVVNKIPSMLKHLESYRQSAVRTEISVYNQYDRFSPSMCKLMDWKIAQSIKFVDLVTNTKGIPDFEKFVKLMTLKSGDPLSPIGLETIKKIRNLWDHISPENQSHWAKGFDMALDSYYEWLHLLKTEINQASDPTIKAFLPLVPEMIVKVM